MNIRILVLFISIVFAGGCATSTPYAVAPHAHVVQNGTTAPPQQVGRTVVATQQQPIMVVQQQQTLPRQANWYGLGSSRPGVMQAIDETIGTARGVIDVIGEWKRIQHPERYSYGYGYGYRGGHSLQRSPRRGHHYRRLPWYVMFEDPHISHH